MAKTERILNNLPATFRPFPRPTALFTLVNALGIPLQEAENLLVEVMKAHWVDHADRGRETIRDLALLAALYSLYPRSDEDVEEFRAHLKRHVRTHLEGTSTVRGILRVTADTLGLTIDHDSLQKPQEVPISRSDDGTQLLFGFSWAEASGQEAQPARITGRPNLSGGVDLRPAGVLRLDIDGTARSINVAAGSVRPEAARLWEIVKTINDSFGAEVARHDGQHLLLSSLTVGPSGRIEFLMPDEPDAADIIFGVAPRVYVGVDAQSAQVIGQVDLSSGVDLSVDRYIRLAMDDIHLAEVDCAGVNPAATTLDEIRSLINTALGGNVANHDGRLLTLQSPTMGSTSSIEIQPAAANDAAERLLGAGMHGLYVGADARPAQLTGRQALHRGVDLRTERMLALKIDDGELTEINCAGQRPEQTSIEEIVEAINAGVGQTVADHDGVFVSLSSLISGPTGRLEVWTSADGDAADRIFGLAPRVYAGTAATSAQIEGQVDLRPDVDLRWRRRIALAVDDRPAVEIDAAGPDPRHTTVEDVVQAINAQVGQVVATTTGGKLVLTSPITGAGSWLALVSRDRLVKAPFLTRTPVQDEATMLLFGYVEKCATGTPPRPAQAIGQVDLSRGVDLRERFFLRLGVDDNPPLDIDCRGGRPRVTQLAEVVAKVKAALGDAVARDDGSHLVLASPTAGLASRLVVERSSGTDAAEPLLGVSQVTVQGRTATSVVFTGTRDLSNGINVVEHYLVNIRIDDGAPVEIDLRAGPEGIPELPEILLDLFDIVDRLNGHLGQGIASHDGRYVIIRSASPGGASALHFEMPSDPEHDATAAVFGIIPPRRYTGAEATGAQLQGRPDLSGGIDLSLRHHLRLAVDGNPPQDINCAGANPAATTLAEVVDAINLVLGPGIAHNEGGHLMLTSPIRGMDSVLAVEPSMATDATDLILGDVVDVYTGEAAAPAVLTAEVSFLGAIDLSQRSMLRIAVDDGPAIDVDVAGRVPERTSADEVVAALNDAFPRRQGQPSAVLTADGRLQLSADQAVALLPLRYLSLFEFPPAPGSPLTVQVVHGAEWTTVNDGVDSEPVLITLTTVHGVVGATFTNRSVAASIRVPTAVGPGRSLRIGLNEAGQPVAEIGGVAVSMETDPWLTALRLPPGTSQWQYTECYSSRFDQDHFNVARFVDGQCRALGVFDLSHFATDPKAPEVAVFAPANGLLDTGTQVSLMWEVHRPGRFALDLPYDLPRQYGGRFDQARFADQPTVPQVKGVIIELEPDQGSLIAWVNATSPLVEAQGMTAAPLGVTPRRVPWSQAVSFEGGTPITPARLVLTEDGLGGFVELRARIPGVWGNRLQLTMSAGNVPGSYDVTLAYDGDDVFENARQKVQEQIVLARAAGVEALITRQVRSR